MIATNKLLSTVAGLAFVGAVALTSPAAHANNIGGSVAGNGGVAGMIGASGGSAAGVGNGAADSTFGGIGQPGTDLPGASVSSISTTTALGTGEDPNVPVAKQIARSTAREAANTDYDVAQAHRNAVETQSRAAIDAGMTTNGSVSAPGM